MECQAMSIESDRVMKDHGELWRKFCRVTVTLHLLSSVILIVVTLSHECTLSQVGYHSGMTLNVVRM